MRESVIILPLLVAGALSAQTLTVGNNVSSPNSSDNPLATVRTAVDLAAPANASGSLDHATFYWSQSACSAAAKLKVFRRVGDTFSLVAERGPFNITSNAMSVTLSPAISVLEGDVIGVARVADCGNPTTYSPTGIVLYSSYIEVAGDATSFTYSASAVRSNEKLAVRATGTATEVVAGVIMSAASNPGRMGSYYRTLVQVLAYPYSSPLTGRFVFHPKLVPGSPSDPSMSFTTIGGAVQSWPDLLAAMGATGEPGSIDIVLPWGAGMPQIGAQVYDDQGASGTTGFREEPVATTNHGYSMGTNIFFPGSTGYLFGPADATRYRSNIAIRSLEAGVTGRLQAYHADGSVAGSSVQFRYGPNTWDQKTWAGFTGATLEDGDYVAISVSQGAAIVDGSIIDNTTNDPADVLARVAFAIQ